MSHFTVGVILKNKEDIREKLARYSECDEDFFERIPYMTKEEYIEEYKRNNNTNLSSKAIWDKAHEEYDDIEGDIIYTSYNPDARYDWYELGGRWSGELRIKYNSEYDIGGRYGDVNEPSREGEDIYVDAAKIKDILWDKMNEASNETIENMEDFWNGYVLGENPGKDYHTFYKPEYYKDQYGTLDNYIRKNTLFYTHDLLLCDEDEDQEWLTMGDMGWFGCDNSTQESLDEYVNKFYEIINNPKYKNYWFITIDCHI